MNEKFLCYSTMAKRASTEIQEIVYLTEEIGNQAGFPGQFYIGKQHGGKKHGGGIS